MMMLVEEGKMSLDDPISKYIPDAPAIWKDITIRHLLTHTSGITEQSRHKIDLRPDYTEDELLKIAGASARLSARRQSGATAIPDT